jgi:hypothetical protein
MKTIKTIEINTPFNKLDAWRVWVASYVANAPKSKLALLCWASGSHHALSEKQIVDNIPYGRSGLDRAEINYLQDIAKRTAYAVVGTAINQDNPFCDVVEPRESVCVHITGNGEATYVFYYGRERA